MAYRISCTWNHEIESHDAYGNSVYENERQELLYSPLNDLMERRFVTGGLVFISGDVHINEIYEVALKRPGASSRFAPEFVSSPLGDNSSLHMARPETGEREWSVASAGSKGRRGFATLEIDTTDAEPEDRWKVEVHYYDERDFAANPYESRLYTLRDRQFKA